MNQQNASLQQLNAQQLFQQQQQQSLNMSYNWRTEVTDEDRNRFVGQLSVALRHLSPGPENQTYNIASNIEASLYQQCTSKNQYLMACAKKFQDIREKLNANSTMQPQMSLPLSLPTNGAVSSAQLELDNFQPSMNQQAQMMQARPQTNFTAMMQQGRPPQNQPNPMQAQMLAQQQRSAAAMAMGASDTSQIFQRPVQQVQNMNNANTTTQPNLNISQQQYQAYVARQMALQLQQHQQSLNGTGQFLPQQLSSLQQQQPMMNMGLTTAAATTNINTPMMTNGATPNNLRSFQQDGNDIIGSTPLTNQQYSVAPVTVPTAITSQQQPFMMRSPQPTSQQAQQMVNQELQMQRLQQQNMMTSQFMQRPMMPQNMSFRPIVTPLQRNNAAAIIKQLEDAISTGRARGIPIPDLPEADKQAIPQLMEEMKPMYDKLDHLLPIFLSITNNTDATRRLIVLKYMFKDQWDVLDQSTYFFNLETCQKLREQFSGYFTWMRNVFDQQKQMQMMALQPQNMNYNMMMASQAQAMALLQRQAQQTSLQMQPQEMTSTVVSAPTPALTDSTTATTDTPVIGNAGTSSPTVGVKRGGINLQLPTTKKQRPQVKQQSQSPPQAQQMLSPSQFQLQSPPQVQQVSLPSQISSLQAQQQQQSPVKQSPELQVKKEVEPETDVPYLSYNGVMMNSSSESPQHSLQDQSSHSSSLQFDEDGLGDLSALLKEGYKDEVMCTADINLYGKVNPGTISFESVGADASFDAFEWSGYNDLFNFDIE